MKGAKASAGEEGFLILDVQTAALPKRHKAVRKEDKQRRMAGCEKKGKERMPDCAKILRKRLCGIIVKEKEGWNGYTDFV